MRADSDRPAISIVTATYNRSRVLACAIESVRRQTFTDWEMVIVGDACTDDTAALVAGLGDPRIRFVNLSRNFGDQAGPNNIGIAESRAPLVAFLNHDDLCPTTWRCAGRSWLVSKPISSSEPPSTSRRSRRCHCASRLC